MHISDEMIAEATAVAEQNGRVYYKIYVVPDTHKLCIVALGRFDEKDYVAQNFLNTVQYDSEEDAQVVLDSIAKYFCIVSGVI